MGAPFVKKVTRAGKQKQNAQVVGVSSFEERPKHVALFCLQKRYPGDGITEGHQIIHHMEKDSLCPLLVLSQQHKQPVYLKKHTYLNTEDKRIVNSLSQLAE